MKKIYYLLLLCLTTTALGYSQINLRSQSFEGLGNWGYTATPTPPISGTTWDVVSSLGGLTATSGANFRGLNNPTSLATAQTYELSFDDADISDYTDIEITFDYMFEVSTGEAMPSILYRVFQDGVDSGYLSIPTTGTDNGMGLIEGQGTITPISINDATLSVRLEVLIYYNYNPFTPNPSTTANIGFDNFKLYSTTPFNGFYYTSDADGWRDGFAPDNTNSADDAYINSGTYTISNDVSLNNVITNSGASITIEKTGSLTIASDINTENSLIIESDSNEFGSLIINGSITGSASYKRHVNIYGDNDFISAPVTGQTFNDFATNNPNLAIASNSNTNIKLFGPFDKTAGGNAYSTWNSELTAQGNNLLLPAVGYRTASKDNSTLTFTGLVNTSNVSIDVFHQSNSNHSQWNFIGNPYTSYLSIHDFLTTNTNTLFQPGKYAVYGYDGDGDDGWLIYNLASTENDAIIMAPGQAFYVAVDDNLTGIMNFTTAMRRTGSSDDFIPGRADNFNKKQFQLNLSTADNLKHSTEVYFFDDIVSLGLDEGYDSTIFGNNSSGFTLFTQLVETNPNYKLGIQSLPNSSLNEEGVAIALGVIAPKGQQITLALKDANFSEDLNIYLEDTTTDTWTLLNEKGYTFTSSTNLNGVGRFYIHASEKETLSIVDNTIESLQFISGNQSIKIKGQLEANTKLSIYDIQGRHMNSINLDKTLNEYTINTSGYSSGIYIIKVEDRVGNKTTKRVILK